jgi:cation transport regulator ChaB
MNAKRLISNELCRAIEHNSLPFNSAHEGLSVLQEEVFELMLEVYKKPAKRSRDKLRDEAVQVAAMAVRFLNDICEVKW